MGRAFMVYLYIMIFLNISMMLCTSCYVHHCSSLFVRHYVRYVIVIVMILKDILLQVILFAF